MALFENPGELPVASDEPVEVETRATLTLPSGWCCGFARWIMKQSDGRRAVEAVFATRGGWRMTFCRETSRPLHWTDARIGDATTRFVQLRRIGSRVDILV